VEFLASTENAQRINSLVDDIYGALMDYQVCMLKYSISTMADLDIRLHYNKTSTMRVVSTLWVSPFILLSQTDPLTGIGRPCPSQQDPSHCRSQLSQWKQARVPEGNKEGSPLGD